jgi:hypothetical protein
MSGVKGRFPAADARSVLLAASPTMFSSFRRTDTQHMEGTIGPEIALG